MERYRSITLKTIANELGITPSTVSKALRNATDVSRETREKVRQLAEKLNYQPNLMAQNLLRRKTNTLGVIIPSLKTTFFPEVVKGIYSKASEYHYKVILMVTYEDVESEKKYLDFLSSFSVDGILISVTQETSDLTVFKRLQQRCFPIVFFDRYVSGLESPVVQVDDDRGAECVIRHLIQGGRTKIAYLGPTEIPTVGSQRFQGYQNGLGAFDLPLDENFVIPCKIDEHDSYLTFKRALKTFSQLPEAVFCMNDYIAMGAFRAIQEAGLSIPQDLAIAGFGDCVETSLLPVPITTVHQPAFEIGTKSVELLIREIELCEEPHESEHIILETTLLVRASTRNEMIKIN